MYKTETLLVCALCICVWSGAADALKIQTHIHLQLQGARLVKRRLAGVIARLQSEVSIICIITLYANVLDGVWKRTHVCAVLIGK